MQGHATGQPESRRRRWKRPLLVVFVLSAGVLVLLLIPATTYYSRTVGGFKG